MYVVLYTEGDTLKILKMEDFPSFVSASYYQKKHGGYILKEVETEEVECTQTSSIPPTSLGD